MVIRIVHDRPLAGRRTVKLRMTGKNPKHTKQVMRSARKKVIRSPRWKRV